MDVRQRDLAGFMQAPKPVLRCLDRVDTITKATNSGLGMDASILRDKCMHSIALKRIENFVIACVVCVCGGCIPRTGSHTLQRWVLLDALQTALTATFVDITFEIGDCCGVVEQRMPPDTRQANEIREVLF